MKMILTRDLHFIYSKKNYLLIIIIILLIGTIPFVFPFVSKDDYLITIFGMNNELIDKRYMIWMFIIQFYFIWLANTLFWNDLKYSYEFIWLRMKPSKWYIYKLISLISILILLDLIISIGFWLLAKIISIEVTLSLLPIIITAFIQFTISIIVIVGMCYFSKLTVYIIILIYGIAISFKYHPFLILFTQTIMDNLYLILLTIPIIIGSYLLVTRKILKLTERSFNND